MKGILADLRAKGESEINAASTISALVLSPYFDLTSTYFMSAGIAGVNPKWSTLGGVVLSRYAVVSNYSFWLPLSCRTC